MTIAKQEVDALVEDFFTKGRSAQVLLLVDLIVTVDTLASTLHAREMHPGFEYERTTGPRKAFDDTVTPDGHGWQRNISKGRSGWERFDYHEEAYWMRRLDGKEDE